MVAIAAGVTAAPALAQNQLYWANVGGPSKISFINLDGSGGGGNVDTTGVTVSTPAGVTLDPSNGKIYWADETLNQIDFANLDGSGAGTVTTTGATINEPFGVAVDPIAGRIYWANAGATAGTPGISFAALNGSGGGDLNTGTATIANPIGVA